MSTLEQRLFSFYCECNKEMSLSRAKVRQVYCPLQKIQVPKAWSSALVAECTTDTGITWPTYPHLWELALREVA